MRVNSFFKYLFIYLTIAGKIPVAYFKEKWYGAAKEAVV